MNEEKTYDDILRDFDERYRKKKMTNLIVSAAIVFFGVSSFLYGVRLEAMPTIFRYMTVDGTLFTTFGALFFIVVNIVELANNTELTRVTVYYFRLSSAVAESVIFIVVMFSQLPLFDEHLPVVDRYDSFIMHVVVPILGVTTFLINDSPIGKLGFRKRWHGTWFVTTYVVIILTLIGTDTLERDLIPYFFLDFKNNGWGLTVIAFVFVYGWAYVMATILSKLNRKLSWLWFRDVVKK